MSISTAFQMTDQQMYPYQTSLEPMVSFSNFILPKCNGDNSGIFDTKWLWKLDEFLTAKEIRIKYSIIPQHLPKSSRDIQKLTQYITKQTNINISELNNINWSADNICTFAPSQKSKKGNLDTCIDSLCINACGVLVGMYFFLSFSMSNSILTLK